MKLIRGKEIRILKVIKETLTKKITGKGNKNIMWSEEENNKTTKENRYVGKLKIENRNRNTEWMSLIMEFNRMKI